jgi:hypothetical protein
LVGSALWRRRVGVGVGNLYEIAVISMRVSTTTPRIAPAAISADTLEIPHQNDTARKGTCGTTVATGGAGFTKGLSCGLNKKGIGAISDSSRKSIGVESCTIDIWNVSMHKIVYTPLLITETKWAESISGCKYDRHTTTSFKNTLGVIPEGMIVTKVSRNDLSSGSLSMLLLLLLPTCTRSDDFYDVVFGVRVMDID